MVFPHACHSIPVRESLTLLQFKRLLAGESYMNCDTHLLYVCKWDYYGVHPLAGDEETLASLDAFAHGSHLCVEQFEPSAELISFQLCSGRSPHLRAPVRFLNLIRALSVLSYARLCGATKAV